MNEAIKRIYGNAISESSYSFPPRTPFYILNGYTASLLKWNDLTCLLIKPLNEDWTLPSIKKQIKTISDICKMPVILDLDRLTALQRTNLIESGIAFVSGSGQLFIPFWAGFFEERIKNAPLTPKKMTDNAQLVYLFLYYLNHEEKTEINLVRISEELGMPKSTCTRAVQVLDGLDLIESRSEGVAKWITLKYNLEKNMHLAEKYMSSPVKRNLYLKELPAQLITKLGGIKALADMSMLAAKETDGSFAVCRDEYLKIPEEFFISRQEYRDFGGIVLEVWKYDPSLLSDTMYVDPISLVLSLKDEPDERVQGELDSIRKQYGMEVE